MSHCMPIPLAMSTCLFLRCLCSLPSSPLNNQLSHSPCPVNPFMLLPQATSLSTQVDDQLLCPLGGLPPHHCLSRSPLIEAVVQPLSSSSFCSSTEPTHPQTKFGHFPVTWSHPHVAGGVNGGRGFGTAEVIDMVVWHTCLCSSPVPSGPAYADPTYTTSI